MVEDPNLTTVRQQLKELIQQRAYKKNSVFKTPSGVVSNFFDFLEVSLKHKGIQLAGEVVYNEIKDLDIHAVGGPSHGIVSILCRAAFLKEIGVFYVRDSIKKEGNIHAPKWIESRIKGGDRVAIVGDVVSSGSQIIRAVQQVMQLGGEIMKIVIIIDTQEGDGIEKIQQFLRTNMLDVPVKVIFTRDELTTETH
jgi:orotate phosphoribosyltransferase